VWLYAAASLVALLAMAISVPASAETDTTETVEQRTSKSLHVRSGGRENRDNGTSTVDTYSSIQEKGARVKPSSSGKTGAGLATSQTSSFDFWIYEADIILFGDDDEDGHFYGIDLLIDADTIYGVADVYAAVYLSLDGGPWNEYAVTDDFTIFGAVGTDEYVLITELMSGYPRGSYDLLIELFDAYDGSFVASLGPEDTSELAYLPLEDFDRDAPRVVTPIIVSQGGGGATGLFTLSMLAIAGLRRRLRQDA
jgi:hypothetical protein